VCKSPPRRNSIGRGASDNRHKKHDLGATAALFLCSRSIPGGVLCRGEYTVSNTGGSWSMMRWRKHIEQDLPHVVETAVPVGARWNAVMDFHARHGIKPCCERSKDGRLRRYVRWRFADREIGEAFATKVAKLIF
jgi:hypothetical protein